MTIPLPRNVRSITLKRIDFFLLSNNSRRIMQIDAKGKSGKHLVLGVQTNKGNTLEQANWLARQWAPKCSKSLTFKLKHTDYHGVESPVETGYATITVEYFSTATEGEIRL